MWHHPNNVSSFTHGVFTTELSKYRRDGRLFLPVIMTVHVWFNLTVFWAEYTIRFLHLHHKVGPFHHQV